MRAICYGLPVEVLFALLGEMLWLTASLPTVLSLMGIGLVIIAMIMHSVAPFIHDQIALKSRARPITYSDNRDQ